MDLRGHPMTGQVRETLSYPPYLAFARMTIKPNDKASYPADY